jgi:hypothetical protein
MTAPQVDDFGQPVTGSADSVAAWRLAYDEMIGFVGDPFVTLAAANKVDDHFVMGPVFCAAYQLLGGVSPDASVVRVDLERAQLRSAAATERERRHVDALTVLHAGEFFDAAARWHAITSDFPEDLTAYRFVHDVCLHIGDDSVRLPSAERAVEAFPDGSFASGRTHGMLAFALEEVERYEEAERHGRRSLSVDATDIWARHALAHVYESKDDTDALSRLLLPTVDVWTPQTGLSNHVWWHVGLRQLHAGDTAAALGVLDERLVSTTAFGLADATSLLWRIGLVDPSAHDGWWARLADHWATNEQRHTCGFLDMHAAMAFARVPDHRGAEAFWTGLAARADCGSFNDVTFRETVPLLAAGLRAFVADRWHEAASSLTAALPTLHRVGGSVVQREIVTDTISSSLRALRTAGSA